MRRALASDANTWVCSLDRIPYLLVQAATQNVMHEFDGVEGRPYYGAPDTVPLWSNFREYEAYLRRDHPATRGWLVEGVGLGPRFLIGEEGLRASGLIQPGSLIRWIYRVKLPDNAASEAAVEKLTSAVRAELPDAGWEIRSRGNASPRRQWFHSVSPV